MAKISIVIVSWNVETLLAQCLQSIFSAQMGHSLQVIVVDNASSDDTVAMIKTNFPQVELLESEVNLGFAKGNNVGLAKASGDYLFLLNPDTQLEADTLTLLADYLAQHPEVGVVGPQLLWPDGSVQSSRRRFPSPGSMVWESTLLEQWFPGNSIARRYKFANVPPTETIAVDWLVGAALFMRREVWQTVGPLDETLFMYFEETDWCRRCAETGWEIHYLPSAKVIHYEGQSSGQVVTARTIRFQRSKIRYAQKWLGSGWALLTRLFLLATFAFQWLEETAKYLIGHKRPLRKERMSAYSAVIKVLAGGGGSEP